MRKSTLASLILVLVLIPNFKPMTAIIMITGIALGAEAGFVCGAAGAFASNFFFSQGPWTPWQMMAYGFGGFAAGLVFHRRKHQNPIVLAVFGFLTILLAVGPLLDTCTVFTTGSRITWKYALAVYAAGFGYNLTQAAATAITIFLVSRPLLEKLDRLKRKYGMMEAN